MVEEVLEAALGVVGQRVDARDVLLGAGDAHRRPACRERARAAHRRHDEPALGRDERHRQQAVRGQVDVEIDRAHDRDGCARHRAQRLAPDVEHGVGAHQRVAHGGGLLGVEALGLVAVLGLAEVEVAGHAQQLVGSHRGARAQAALGDVGLDRPEVAAAVEDHRDGVADGQPVDPQRHGSRGRVVQQGTPKELIPVPVVMAFVLHRPSLVRDAMPMCTGITRRNAEYRLRPGGVG